MTVEEMIEALERCDPHKPVVIAVAAEDAFGRPLTIANDIIRAEALSPQSIANPVKLIMGLAYCPVK